MRHDGRRNASWPEPLATEDYVRRTVCSIKSAFRCLRMSPGLLMVDDPEDCQMGPGLYAISAVIDT